MSVPKVCQKATFTPSFKVTFGLFTCADLIYKFPAVAMVDDGVTHFIMPAAWSDEMAQMQVDDTPSFESDLMRISHDDDSTRGDR